MNLNTVFCKYTLPPATTPATKRPAGVAIMKLRNIRLVFNFQLSTVKYP